MFAQPDQWTIDDIDGLATVKMWGHLPSIDGKMSEKILVRIEGFLPSFRIELPYIVNHRPFFWKSETLAVYCKWLRTTLGDDQPVEIEYKMKRKLYFCKSRLTEDGKLQHQQYPFLTPRFFSLESMRKALKLLKRANNIPGIGYVEVHIREDNVHQAHKFRTEKGIKYCGWTHFKGDLIRSSEKISYCPSEYRVSYEDIRTATEEETKGKKCLPLICSFDIETYSSNHNKFPNANYALDVLYQISMVFQTSTKPESREKILLQVGEIADIKGVTIYRERSEVELIQRFCKIVMEKNPSVLIGYNILCFDIAYMNSRLDLYLQQWPHLSLLKDQEPTPRKLNWESSAYGANNYTLLDGVEGRIFIDLLQIVRKDVTLRLDSYSLDSVAHHYLKKTKHPVSAKQMFKIFDLIQEAEASMKLSSTEEEKHQAETKMKNARDEMGKVGEYCVNDSCLPLDLADHLNTYVNLSEFCSVVSVGLTEIFTRGQMIRVFNQLYVFCQQDNIVIDSRVIDIGRYQGGKVEKPIPGRYEYVSTFDFESLYPNIIRQGNMCYVTLIPPDSNIPDSMCEIIEIESGDEEKKVLRRHRFLKAEYEVGLLPKIVSALLDERKRVKKMMTDDLLKSDPFLYSVLNAKQNALKVSANSVYGITGATKGNIPLPEVAESVTSQGRKKLLIAKKTVEEDLGGKVIYGDTDSVMIDTGAKSEKECADNGQRISDYLTKKTGLRMAYEECSRVFLPICPKKYLKLDFRGKLKMKGVMSARRDNCEWARDVYKEVCSMLMMSKPPIYEVLDIVHERCLELLSRSVPLSKIITTKQMGASYKLDSAPMKVFGDEMNKLGRPVEAGERIPFVLVKSEEKKMGYKMKTLEVFKEGGYKLDLENYIEKMLCTHIDQILSIVYKDEIAQFTKTYEDCTEHYRKHGIKKKRGHLVTHINEWYMFYWCKVLYHKRKVLEELVSLV